MLLGFSIYLLIGLVFTELAERDWKTGKRRPLPSSAFFFGTLLWPLFLFAVARAILKGK